MVETRQCPECGCEGFVGENIDTYYIRLEDSEEIDCEGNEFTLTKVIVEDQDVLGDIQAMEITCAKCGKRAEFDDTEWVWEN